MIHKINLILKQELAKNPNLTASEFARLLKIKIVQYNV